MEYLRKNGENIFWLLILVSTVLPFLIISWHCHPVLMDDYAMANLVHEKGFWGAQYYYYYSWTGRYFSNMLVSISPMVYGAEWAFKYNAILFFIALVAACYYLCKKFLNGFKSRDLINGVAVFIFCFVIILPQPQSAFFWQAALYYTSVSYVLTFLFLAALINFYYSGNKKLNGTIVMLLLIAIVGSYETNMVYIDLMVLLFALCTLLRKGNFIYPGLMVLCASVFSFIVMSAPGNGARTGFCYTGAHMLMPSLNNTLHWGTKALINFHWLPFMLFVGVILAAVLYNKIRVDDKLKRFFMIKPLYALICCITIPYIGMFIFFWSTGNEPAPRTVNSMWFYFCAGMIYFSFSCMVWLKERKSELKFPELGKAMIYPMIIGGYLFFGHNITMAYKDIFSGVIFAYDKERTEQENIIKSSKADTCIVDSIRHIPNSVYFIEYPDKPNWMNFSLWEYYHKKYIGLKGRKIYRQ